MTPPRKSNNIKPLSSHVSRMLDNYFKDLNGHKPANLYDLVINEVEAPLLQSVMSYAEGNQSRAARILGINRNTLRKKLIQHGLE